jgi:cytochrome c oxidase assembly protein subunit 15
LIFFLSWDIWPSSMASFLPGIGRAAPRLSRDFFVCQQCLKQSSPAFRNLQRSSLRNVRFNSTVVPESALPKASPLRSLSEKISITDEKLVKKKFYPETSSKSVAYWLLGSAASVFGIVTFGGLTRLTESGYVRLLSSIPNANALQIKHHRMEARYRIPPSPLCL